MTGDNMKEELIRSYAKLMKELELSALEIKENDVSIRLERNTGTCIPAPVNGVSDLPAELSESEIPDYEKITSPMVGVFYEAPAENADPFVKIGDRVKKGDTLCIIEAMKLMNEVTAERDGTIIDICVKNAQTVEYGTVLFHIVD